MVAHFQAPIRFAVAYGSGAFPQRGYEAVARQDVVVDFIFAVDDPEQWHTANMAQNPHHYSFLRHLGSRTVTAVQQMGAGVYYNSLVEINGRVRALSFPFSFFLFLFFFCLVLFLSFSSPPCPSFSSKT